MLAGALVGGVIGYAGFGLLGADLGEEIKPALREQFGGWTALVVVALAVLAGFAAIAVHELGHVLGGAAARFRFWLYVVGPLRVERDEATGRITVGLNREASLYGGVAASLPTDTRDLPRRLALMVAGGPLASVALALLAWLPLGLGAPLSALARLALGLLTALSAGLAGVTLLPMRSGGFTSDGGRLLRLARGGPVARREAATLPLLGLFAAETPPREWPRELIDAATELRDGSMEECYAAVFAYYHALDSGDAARAGWWIDRVVELSGAYPPALAPSLFVEAAYFEGACRRDAARARRLLARVPEKSFVVKPFDRARAEAALALAEGDRERAREHARRALAAIPAGSAFRRERLHEILRATEAPAAAAV